MSIKKTAVSLVVLARSNKLDAPALVEPITYSFGNIELRGLQIDWFMKYESSSITTDNLWAKILASKAYAVSDCSYSHTS